MFRILILVPYQQLLLGTTIIDNLGVESNGLVVKSYTTKRLEIGDWDMTANTQTTVSHGLSATEWKTILRSDALIRNDSDTVYAPLNGIEAPSTGLPKWWCCIL